MTDSDRPAFGELMIGIGEAFDKQVSVAQLEIYFRALADLPIESVRRAANNHAKLHKFFPRIAELREAVDGPINDRADAAWVQLLELVRRVGAYGMPTWPDLVLKRTALDLYGGWRSLCQRLPGEGPELLGAAKLFKATYATFARTHARGQLTEQDDCLSVDQARNLRTELEKRGLPHHGLGLVVKQPRAR